MRSHLFSPAPAAVGAALLFGFALVTFLVGTRRLEQVDMALMRAAHSVSGETLDYVAGILNYAAAAEVTLAAMLVLSGWLWWRGVPRRRAFAPLLFLASIPPELVLKFTLDQPVPSAGFYRKTLPYGLLSLPVMQSFPSGHAIRTAFMAILIGYLVWRTLGLRRAVPLWLGVAALCAVEAWSRSYQGHHWPMDVAGGYLLGGGLAFLAVAVLDPAIRRLADSKNAPDQPVLVRGNRRTDAGRRLVSHS